MTPQTQVPFAVVPVELVENSENCDVATGTAIAIPQTGPWGTSCATIRVMLGDLYYGDNLT